MKNIGETTQYLVTIIISLLYQINKDQHVY